MFRKPKKPVISPNIDLYHGSNVMFEKPDPDVNKLPCDLGKGFYLTKDWKRAVSRAEEKALSNKTTEKWVMKFVFDAERAYRDAREGQLYLKRYKEDKEWLDTVWFYWDESKRGLRGEKQGWRNCYTAIH